MKGELLRNTPRFGKFIGKKEEFKEFLKEMSLYLDYKQKRGNLEWQVKS